MLLAGANWSGEGHHDSDFRATAEPVPGLLQDVHADRRVRLLLRELDMLGTIGTLLTD